MIKIREILLSLKRRYRNNKPNQLLRQKINSKANEKALNKSIARTLHTDLLVVHSIKLQICIRDKTSI